MKELDIIQTVFGLISGNIPMEYVSFQLVYSIDIVPIENGKKFELGKFQGSYTSIEGQERFIDGSFGQGRAFGGIESSLKCLRELMAKKSQNQVKWSEIVLDYEKGGEVKTRFSYPEPSEGILS